MNAGYEKSVLKALLIYVEYAHYADCFSLFFAESSSFLLQCIA